MSSNGVFQDGDTTMDSFETTHCPACAKVSLSSDQISVYHTLHDLIDKRVPKVILIDAPSGTGKTRILSTLAQNYSNEVQFAVLTKNLADELTESNSGVTVETYCSYLRKNFSGFQRYLEFGEVRDMFKLDNLSNTDVLFKLITYAQRYASPSTKVIIMDDCAIMDPLMLLLLYIVSLRNKITLIFSGNKMQLRSMYETKLHSGTILYNRNNYDVLELFSDLTITELIENLRSDDQSFLEKVARFGNAIAEYRTMKPFHFNLRYLLYTLFRGKFNPIIPHSPDALFMAQFRAVLPSEINTTTYHATTGRTISSDVELSIDCADHSRFADATAVYIGLCSLSSESNIRKFHAEQYLPSFVATDIMATEDKETYYYHCPAMGDYPDISEHVGNKNGDENLKSFLMGVSWTTVDKINDFENYKFDGFFRIKRSVYKKNKKEVGTITDSPLMEMTKFVKDEPHVVIDVIQKIQTLCPEEAKKVLVDAYEKWKVQQREADKK